MTKITKKTAAKTAAAKKPAKAIGPKSTVTAADVAFIARAKEFKVSILLGRGQFKSAMRPTLATARAWAPVLEKEANNGRLAMIHAIDGERAVLVPASYAPEPAMMVGPNGLSYKAGPQPAKVAPMGKQPAIFPAIKFGKPSKVAAVDLAAAEAEAAELAAVKAKAAGKPAKAEKPAKKAAAKKAAAKPAKAATAKAPRAAKKGSKAEIAAKMLTTGKGSTRKAIVEAVDGWNVDLKQLCARKNFELTKSADGVFSAK